MSHAAWGNVVLAGILALAFAAFLGTWLWADRRRPQASAMGILTASVVAFEAVLLLSLLVLWLLHVNDIA